MTLVSRLGIAAVIVAVLTLCAALTLGLFPRTLIGFVLLVAAGIPVALAMEFLSELMGERGQAWYVRAGALIALVVLVGGFWCWWPSHSAFVNFNFLGSH